MEYFSKSAKNAAAEAFSSCLPATFCLCNDAD